MRRLRHQLGALVRDWPRFARALRRRQWWVMHNRNERITTDGRGVRCEWEFTSDLHIARVFPSTGTRLMQIALNDWPIGFSDAPREGLGSPLVSFVIGHRGLERLPHLLFTLRSIAAQTEARVECVVVEQSIEREIESRLPSWVRYVHTPLPRADYPYNRSWTLNTGVRLARGSIVVLHDNDMLVPRRYAAELIDRVGEGAQFIDLKRFTFYLTPGQTERLFASGRLQEGPATIVQNLRGASIAALRDSYLSIGGFDETFVGWGGEDNDFWERAEANGGTYEFGYLPFVHLSHPPQPEKLQGSAAPAILRLADLRSIPPRERTDRLRVRKTGRLDSPDDQG